MQVVRALKRGLFASDPSSAELNTQRIAVDRLRSRVAAQENNAEIISGPTGCGGGGDEGPRPPPLL